MSAKLVAAVLTACALGGCAPPEKGLFTYCSDAPGPDGGAAPAGVTYNRDVKPIVDAKCAGCHEPGGLGPFSLRTYDEVFAYRAAALASVESRRMPPWMAAPCCGEYHQDRSLTSAERAIFTAWVNAGGPRGDDPPAADAPPAPVISRVDVTLTMPAAYAPRPPKGSTDDNRCFVFDWPHPRPGFVTGLDIQPGNRAIVHHLLMGVVSAEDGRALRAKEGKDGRPGFSCPGGAFGAKVINFIGGGVVGAEFPNGIGTEVKVGSAVVLQIHYSTAHTQEVAPTDRTTVRFRVDDQARTGKTIVVANPFWLVDEAMKVKAGDPDAVFFYRFKPVLFTRGKRVQIHSAAPHMHAFGSRLLLGIIRKDGTKECLLEIPTWRFGWEQTFWLKSPRTLEPDDQVYVECHFDNSEARQPIVDNVRAKPRDIAWGGDNQDMCAGFLGFTEE